MSLRPVAALSTLSKSHSWAATRFRRPILYHSICRTLGEVAGEDAQAFDTIARAVAVLLEAPDAAEYLPDLAMSVMPALRHEDGAVRRLCCTIMGRHLALKDNTHLQEVASALPPVMQVRRRHVATSTLWRPGAQQTARLQHIHKRRSCAAYRLCVQDEDTGVAAEAASALQSVALHPDQLRQLLGEGACRKALDALMDGSATVRSRGLACLIACASASPEAAQAVLESGALCVVDRSRMEHACHCARVCGVRRIVMFLCLPKHQEPVRPGIWLLEAFRPEQHLSSGR